MIGRTQRIDQCINEINSIAKSYNLEVWPNVRDTLMDIIESGMVSLEDKLKAFDLYKFKQENLKIFSFKAELLFLPLLYYNF